ncbi:two-component system NarL family response regulator [Haloferula luteola]|uniref:Two-component system NarL family response regulator n=1 Tax=Haloferula luteola TaxID=595692 RepID=A0A840V243_9BACT|nr:response regulator transcription factor [Haloferula luteola]MBB5352062.1 two-component system NarL family response regulator [Haloferula luteola]
MKPPLRILIVDDHFFVRAGLKSSLESEPDLTICGEAANAAEALLAHSTLRPDLILLDLRLPDRDGLDLLEHLKNRDPSTQVIVFSVDETETDIARALEAGAAGYLPKSSPRSQLLAGIRAVAEGGTSFPPTIAAKFREHRSRTPLSPREREILHLIVDGQPNKLIAAALGISENTVKLHVSNLLAKTDAPDRTSIVKLAIQRGWVRP